MAGGKKYSGQKVDETSCKTFNAEIMRSLVSRKMQKNKTFFEVKLQAQA